MVYNYEYPYTDPNRFNVDWLLNRIKELGIEMKEFVNLNTIKFHDPIQWDITKQYERLEIVSNDGVAYLSKQPVPVGVPITNTDYWQIIGNFGIDGDRIRENIASLNEKENLLAQYSHNEGTLLWWKGDLYRATASIPIGGAIVLGTNIEALTVEEKIEEVNSYAHDIYTELDGKIDDVNDRIDDEVLKYLDFSTGLTEGNVLIYDNTLQKYVGKEFVQHDPSIVNVIDFNPTLNGADDSEVVQNAFDYAKDNNYNVVSFKGIDEICFKEVDIDCSVEVIATNTVLKQLPLTNGSEHGFTLFNIDNNDVDVTFNGGTYRGLYSSGTYDPQGVRGYAINVVKAKSITIKNITFNKFNCRNVIIPTLFYERTPVTIKVLDTRSTIIDNCIFDTVYGEELIYVMNKNLPRKDINVQFSNCLVKSCNTSSLDFVGNNATTYNNVFEYDYAGTIYNVFALNWNAWCEAFLGAISGAYDNCEWNYFQGLSFKANNVYVPKLTGAVFQIAAQTAEVSNVIVGLDSSATQGSVFRPLGGFNGTPQTIHPECSTAYLPNCDVSIKNVSNLTKTKQLAITFGGGNIGVVPNILVDGFEASDVGWVYNALNSNIVFKRCKIKGRVHNTHSSTLKFGLAFQPSEDPQSIMVEDCIFTDTQYIVQNTSVPVMISTSRSSNCKVSITSSPTTQSVGACLGITV